MEAFETYDRLINAIDRDSPLAPQPVPVPEFECGLFLVMHWPGVPMSSHWSREHGGDVGFLDLGFISMYNTRSFQQFVVSMEGEPPWSRVRDLFPPLIRALQQPRLPCGLPASIDGESLSDGSSCSS